MRCFLVFSSSCVDLEDFRRIVYGYDEELFKELCIVRECIYTCISSGVNG